jgi:hypothetical protein
MFYYALCWSLFGLVSNTDVQLLSVNHTGYNYTWRSCYHLQSVMKPLSKFSGQKTELWVTVTLCNFLDGVNQMWILKINKDLLVSAQSRSLSSCNSIKIFDSSTLYSAVLHSKLKKQKKTDKTKLIQLCFIRYKYLVSERGKSYLVK